METERRSGCRHGAPSAESLVAAIARGDVAAFDTLYSPGRRPGARGGAAILRDPDLAQDVAQEALVEIWRQAPRFDPSRGSAMAWLMTIAHRRAVDRVRREETQSGLAARAAAVHEVPHADEVPAGVERSLDAARVRRAMSGLSPVQREAIELAYWRGYTHQEVSTVLAVPLGTAKTRIRDGLIRLRDVLTVERGPRVNLHALTGAYVLDALDADERAAFEAHLPGCPDCRAEVASLAEATTRMALTDALPPPPAMLDAVRAQIARTPQLPPAPARRRRRPRCRRQTVGTERRAAGRDP